MGQKHPWNKRLKDGNLRQGIQIPLTAPFELTVILDC